MNSYNAWKCWIVLLNNGFDVLLVIFKNEVRGNPRDLRVSDPTTSTLKLSWSGAPGKVKQYLVTYTPVAGGDTQEVTVRGDKTNTVLRRLSEGTKYTLSVTALYASGAGEALFGEGATLEGNYSPTWWKSLNLLVSLHWRSLKCFQRVQCAAFFSLRNLHWKNEDAYNWSVRDIECRQLKRVKLDRE